MASRVCRLPLLTSEAVLTELFHLVGDSREEVEAAWNSFVPARCDPARSKTPKSRAPWTSRTPLWCSLQNVSLCRLSSPWITRISIRIGSMAAAGSASCPLTARRVPRTVRCNRKRHPDRHASMDVILRCGCRRGSDRLQAWTELRRLRPRSMDSPTKNTGASSNGFVCATKNGGTISWIPTHPPASSISSLTKRRANRIRTFSESGRRKSEIRRYPAVLDAVPGSTN